jgi:pimeloyl-ACP methyl ester carboxylesterase
VRTVALVHGAWHGPWCWAPVLAGLDERGVPAIAVDLPGPDLHADADHVRSVIDSLDGPVVLVGHSYGGAVITDAGVHPAVEHLVFLAAFALDEGDTLASLFEQAEGSDLLPAVQVRDDGTSTTLDLDLAAKAFYADCDPVDVERAVGLLRPQPMGSITQSPRAVAWRARPTTYVVCGADRALPPRLQRDMAARIPGAAIVELPDTSHSPFFSQPGELVDLLTGLAAP